MDYLLGRKSEDCVAASLQLLVASGVIVALLFMDAAIDLDDKPHRQANEVYDVRTNRVLTSELKSAQVLPAKRRPEPSFARRGPAAKITRCPKQPRTRNDIAVVTIHDTKVCRSCAKLQAPPTSTLCSPSRTDVTRCLPLSSAEGRGSGRGLLGVTGSGGGARRVLGEEKGPVRSGRALSLVQPKLQRSISLGRSRPPSKRHTRTSRGSPSHPPRRR